MQGDDGMNLTSRATGAAVAAVSADAAETGLVTLAVVRVSAAVARKGVRLAQQMHVGPCIPVGIRLTSKKG
jgi:hypothetical protein